MLLEVYRHRRVLEHRLLADGLLDDGLSSRFWTTNFTGMSDCAPDSSVATKVTTSSPPSWRARHVRDQRLWLSVTLMWGFAGTVMVNESPASTS